MRAIAARLSPWLPVAKQDDLVARQMCGKASWRRENPACHRDSRIRALRRSTRSIARPTMHDMRPAATAASATARMRATLEAKVVTTTRPVAFPMISRRVFATSASEGLMPSRKILVESQTSASTPSPPISARRFCIGLLADPRRRIDFPIAGMQNRAERRADRERATFRDGMRHGDEFDLERSES